MDKDCKIPFWTLFGITIFVLVVVIVAFVVILWYLYRYRTAFFGAVFNQNQCGSVYDAYKCQYVDIDPPIPTQFPNRFSKEIALYCAQRILNLEYLSAGVPLNIPPPLELVSLLQTNEPDTPLFGYVAVDLVNK